MSDLKLDKYEKEILESYETEEFESVLTSKRQSELSQIAENTYQVSYEALQPTSKPAI